MKDMIYYDIIAEHTWSLYDMDLELPLPLKSTTTSLRIDLIRASNRKTNDIMSALATFTSTRVYDSDANYMAIAHYCASYKPHKEVHLESVVYNHPITAFYNEELDIYVDSNGVEIAELND
jgi:hypothetical protein